MQAGRLRHRVTIQNYVTTRSPSGQPVEQWSDGETVWGEVLAVSGREQLSSGAESPEATVRVWMRFRKDISTASRLKILTGPLAGALLNVVGQPIPDRKGARLEILCKRGTEK